ncbi:MAG TPA: o-succinylbenzoate synthase, partial [Vicinamibacteria bacterium]|nr:o-succinylbenzoate synthase [Vicinamibacteria bacterium]
RVRLLALPLRRPFQTSFGRTTRKEFLLVTVQAQGLAGHGECVADVRPDYLPETNQTAVHVLRDFLVPAALALDLARAEDMAAAFTGVRGHEMAKAALEMAVFELFARRAGLPLWRLLGGSGGAIPAGVSIGLQDDTAALLARVEEEVAAGYRRVKIKIEPGRDRALVEAVRARWPSLPLMVDANSAYTLADADHLATLDGQGLMMIEQPLGHDDMVDHAVLQRRLRTPLCLDESVRCAEDARKALEMGACRIVNVKAGRVGGFAQSRALAEVCRARGAPAWCGGMLESGIGRLANVHLQTLPGFTLPGDTSASLRTFAEDLVEPPVTVSPDGLIAVPDGPGIGHEIVWPRVEKATVWQEEWG